MSSLTHARELWGRGEWLQAESEIAALLHDSPDDPDALRSLAEIYAGSARARQSIPLWRRLAQLRPADAGVLRQLAQALLAERAAAEAIDVLHATRTPRPAMRCGWECRC